MPRCCEVVASVRVPGLHRWPLAPNDVSFLRHPHRHEFHIRAWKRVTDLDREVEIIDLKARVLCALAGVGCGPHATTNLLDFGTLSCEQVALALVELVGLSACEVLEDGENGAVVEAA